MQMTGAAYNIAPPGGNESSNEEDDGEERNSHGSTFYEGRSQTCSMKFIMSILSHMGKFLITNNLPHCLLLIQDDSRFTSIEKPRNPLLLHVLMGKNHDNKKRKKTQKKKKKKKKKKVNFGVHLKALGYRKFKAFGYRKLEKALRTS